jgi:hypothetical protein
MDLWIGLEEKLKELLLNGYCKFPSTRDLLANSDIYEECLTELREKTFGENLTGNEKLLSILGITEFLAPKLHNLAVNKFNYKGNVGNIYNVCRLVRSGDTSEGFRGHFDSHLFTLVTPIQIPDAQKTQNNGKLHFFPNARGHPKNEMVNILGKIKFKKFNNEKGFSNLSKKIVRKTETFQDYQPLLFLGNTTYHGNSPVQGDNQENRMTILTHFYDPSPRYGIGAILRKIRNR